MFITKTMKRNVRHLGMYVDNKLEQSRPARHQAIGSFLFPYALAALTWLSILAYFSFNSLDLPMWNLIPSLIVFTMYLIVQFIKTINAKNAGKTLLYAIYNLVTTTICCILLPYQLPLWVAITVGVIETLLVFLLSIISVATVKEHYRHDVVPQ